MALLCFLQSGAQSERGPLAAAGRQASLRKEFDRLVYLPGGTFIVNEYEGADSITISAPARATLRGFYLGKTEITNREYRRFVHAVRDSIARRLLGSAGVGTATINWKDPALAPMMQAPEDRVYGKMAVNTDAIVYRPAGSDSDIRIYPDTLCWVRYSNYSGNEPLTHHYFANPAFDEYPVVGVSRQQAMAYCAWLQQEWNKALEREGRTERVSVRLPADFEWQYGAASLPAKKTEFLSFDDHRTRIYDPAQRWAAQTPLVGIPQSNQGYRVNFGAVRDDAGFFVKGFADDGFLFTAPVTRYRPNPKGLYQMEGNVAEWTSSAATSVLDFSLYGDDSRPAGRDRNERFHDQLPANSVFMNRDREAARKLLEPYAIVKGGSWLTTPFYLQPGVQQYFAPTESRPYIGFRILVEVLPGR